VMRDGARPQCGHAASEAGTKPVQPGHFVSFFM
jgi:hypothetical protein